MDTHPNLELNKRPTAMVYRSQPVWISRKVIRWTVLDEDQTR